MNLMRAKNLVDAASGVKPETALERLKNARAELEFIMKKLPQHRDAMLLMKRCEGKIVAMAKRWLEGARATEKLMGCDRAVGQFKIIADTLRDIAPDTAKRAGKYARACH